MSLSSRIHRYYDLIFVLVEKDLKTRYKSSFLGYLWSLGMPLMQALIFSFVFKIIMRFQIENYTIFLLLGLFLWQWMNNSILSSPHTYILNASIIKKVHFERGILSLSVVILELFHFLLTLPVILVFIYFSNIELTWKAAAAGSSSRVFVELTVDQHGSSPLAVRCEFADTGIRNGRRRPE